MRVLCVMNRPILGGNGGPPINRPTGRFLVELSTEVDEFPVEQGRFDSWDTATFADFELAPQPKVRGDFFRSADLLVLPTHMERFPRVPYEAMTYGMPVVVGFVGGIPSVMRDCENCLEIPVKDPRGLAEIVRPALAASSRSHRPTAGGIATMRESLDTDRPTPPHQDLARLSP